MVLKLAIFISGRGSNMLSILKACENPDYPAEVKLVFSNRPDASGLKVAQEKSIRKLSKIIKCLCRSI